MKKITYLATTLLLISLSAQGQTMLTLNEYRSRVLDYSQALKMSGESVIASNEKVRMTKTGYLPALGLSAQGSYQEGNLISFGPMTMKNYAYNTTLALQQKVYAGGSVKAGSQSAEIESAMSEVALENAVKQVSYAAEMTYWGYAASAEQRDIARQYVEIIKELYTIVQSRFDNGYISRTDLLMVETRLNEAQLQLITADKYYQTALQQLGTLLGESQPPVYAVGDSVSRVTPISDVLAGEMPLESRPEYRMASLELDFQRQNIAVMRARYNPQLSVGVQGVYGTPSLNFDGKAKTYGVAFANLSVPLFMWGERRRAVSMVRSGVRAREYALTNTTDQINGEVENARINLMQTLKQADIARRNMRVSEETLDLNTFSYNEGRCPILDVLQAQLAWIQAYTAYVTANHSYQVATADFKKATSR